MCKVYEFPERMKLTPELEERAKQLARDYSDLIVDAVNELLGDEFAMEEMEDVTNLIVEAYTEELERYVYSMDEGL